MGLLGEIILAAFLMGAVVMYWIMKGDDECL